MLISERVLRRVVIAAQPVLADIDSRISDGRAHLADYPGDIRVLDHQDISARVDIQQELVDPYDPRQHIPENSPDHGDSPVVRDRGAGDLAGVIGLIRDSSLHLYSALTGQVSRH